MSKVSRKSITFNQNIKKYDYQKNILTLKRPEQVFFITKLKI